MSCRKEVLSEAAWSKVSGGTSRVLVRPGADALAMMAMLQAAGLPCRIAAPLKVAFARRRCDDSHRPCDAIPESSR
jgi:hypothetical protein